MFEKEIYIARRDALKNQFQSGFLLFLGNEECGINYSDNTYHYRQDSTFLNYFGISKPGLIGWIDNDRDEVYLFGDDPTIDSIVWTGSQPAIHELAQQTGVTHTGTLSDFIRIITKIDKKRVRYLPPYRGEHLLKLKEYLGYSPSEVMVHVSNEFIVAVSRQRII